MEQKCANCGNGKWRDGVTPITETCCKCHYVDKGALGPQPSNWIPKTQTNADRIRAMSDEELAIFVRAVVIADGCPNGDTDCKECTVMSICNQSGLYGHETEWLKQPAEGDVNNV